MRSLSVCSLLFVAFLAVFVSCRPDGVLDKVEDGADEVEDNAKSVFDTIKDTVVEKAHQAKDLAEDFADYTSQKVRKKGRVPKFCNRKLGTMGWKGDISNNSIQEIHNFSCDQFCATIDK